MVGLLAFLGMLWMVIHVLDDARRWTVYSDRELWGLLCGLELGVLVHMVTSLFLHASYIRYFWLLLALAVAAAALPRRQTQAEFLPGIMRNAPGRLEREYKLRWRWHSHWPELAVHEARVSYGVCSLPVYWYVHLQLHWQLCTEMPMRRLMVSGFHRPRSWHCQTTGRHGMRS